jgi:Recombinase
VLKLACRSVADGKSVSEVLRQANAAGLRSDRGRPLSLQTFRAVRRNPVIAGIIRIPKWNINRAGDFEPLISESTFRRIQPAHDRPGDL